MPQWIAKLLGKFAGSKIGLTEESKMDGTKKWFLSKSVWTGIVTGLLGIYSVIAPNVGGPAIPEWVFALLGGLGVYTRVNATKTIG